MCVLAVSGCVARVQPTTVILVRHAEREALSTPDADLTAEGRVRAKDLLGAARDAGIQAIIITQFARTRSTVEPLAAALGISPEVVPDTGSRHPIEVADLILKQHAGQTVLVVGHGHTVPAIMRALGAPFTAPRLCENEYDLMFVVTVTPYKPARVVRARYGAHPLPDSICAK